MSRRMHAKKVNLVDAARYFIGGQSYALSDSRLQGALERVHASAERPRCMCVPGGVEMYVAKHTEFVIKRMPDTGRLHHVSCPSFEPEPATSGLGELLGEAIVEHTPEQVELRTSFPLARMAGGRSARGLTSEGGSPGEPNAVNVPPRRMSLRAVLHFLYDRAGFNRWYPAMDGKRSQAVIHHHLLAAARGVTLKGGALEACLFVPEQFRVAEAEQIAQRRRQRLSTLLPCESDGRFKMAILIGQLTDDEATAYGRRLTVKHMPDAPLYIDHAAWSRAQRAFGLTLQALDADLAHKPRAVMVALIHAKREHLYQVDSLSLMLVTEQWIPLDGLHELPLIEALQREGRSFLKPLRFDARSSAAFPNVLLLDAGPVAVPLHVASAFLSARERAAKDRAVNQGGPAAWVWKTGEPMPTLPAKVAPRMTSGPAPRP
jgi:hypothetical protein